LQADPAASASVMWNPAAWFVGVYRWIGGDERPIFSTLAARGAIAGVGIIGLALVWYPLAHGRCLRNVIASEGRTLGATSRGWATIAATVLGPLLPTPLQRGLAAYMLATLGRSHTHRFVIGMYAAIAFLLALPLASRLFQVPTTAFRQSAWFMVPLGAVFWLVCGVRVATMMPVDPEANWVFRLTEPADKRGVLGAVATVMTSVTCLPVAAVVATILLAMGEPRLASTVFLVVLLAGLCLIELLTITMKTIPFTCTYLPGQLKLRLFWAGYFFLWLAFVVRLGGWGVWALQSNRNTIRLALFLLLVWAVLRLWHQLRVRKIATFVYDQQEPSLLTTMRIHGT